MLKKVLAVFLTGLFCINIVGFGTAYADAIDEAKAQKEQIDKQIQQAKRKHREAKQRAERAAGDFNSVVNKLGKLQRRSAELEKREGQLQNSVKDNAAKLQRKKEELVERRKIYRERLRNIYISGQVSYIDVLLGAQDFGDLVGRMYLLEKVVTSDLELLQEISSTVQEIKDRSVRQKQEIAQIQTTQEQLARDKEDMAVLREKRRKLLNAAEQEESQAEGEYHKFIEIGERIGAMLKEMEKANPQRFPDKADNFIWPACGYITSYAGWRVHPVFGTKKYHSGMDIGVDYYTPIKAANRGTITYAGWMNGYGNTVMIDHGEGLVTLYAHCSSIKCNEGQFVHQGDVVALSGATGWATGPHLHFEIRVHGDVVDPLIYLKESDNVY